MKLQAMAELAVNYVNTTNRHVFLTGKAGTGKTTFLKYIISHTHKRTVVAAPTGIAAINAGGVTLHSLLQLPFGSFVPENIPLDVSEGRVSIPQTLFQNSKFNSKKRQLLEEIELLIIDEVSMLRADILDCIDHTLRHIRRNATPFGGLQILFIGDLMQLPPVVTEHEKSLLSNFYPNFYFFEAKALKEALLIHVELKKIFRQQDQGFIELLNRLRYNEQTQDDYVFLNRFYKPEFKQTEETGYIYLTTHNYKADKLNQQKLGELEAESHNFNAHIEGSFPDSMFPNVSELHLKEGAQVMFIKNDPSGEGQFFNGKIGMISNLSEEEIWVRFENGSEVLVTPYKWENKKYSIGKESNEIQETLLGSFEQYPIKLAWAVTIHKSQGLTFEKAILDLSRTFAPGQLYVALSRLKSLEGLVLSSKLPDNPPKTDESLSRFNSINVDEEILKKNLKADQKSFIAEMGTKVFDFSSLIKKLHDHQQSFTKDENRSVKQKYSTWTKEIVEETLPLQTVGNSFTKEIHRILQTDEYIDQLNDRFCKAKTYFLTILAPITERVQSHIQFIANEKKVKAYRKELEEIEDAFIKKIGEIERIVFLAIVLKTGDFSTQKLDTTSSLKLTLAKGKAQKEKKTTAEISYELYKKGKAIKEIAKDRNLIESTIESHLAQYVENGMIKIEDLVSANKVKKILEVLESEAVGLREIKLKLPKNFTFGEIKLVIAYQKSRHN